MFTSDFFRKNRAALRAGLPKDVVIVLSAHGQLQRSNDTTFPFRQESNFWYFTGINEPDCILVIEQDAEYLIVPSRSHVHEVFDGRLSGERLKAVSGITMIYSEADGWQQVRTCLQRTQRVATLPAPSRYRHNDGMYTNPAQSRLVQRLRANNRKIEFFDISPLAAELRCIKQPPELTALREAIRTTSQAFNALAEQDLTQYRYEYEIEAELTHSYKKQGMVHGYEPVVASGGNACTLHYVKNDASIVKQQLLLIDSGAELSNYSADITRTFSVGAATARQRQVYKIVAEAQAHVLNKVRPGTSLRELDKVACRFLGDRLKELGLITSATDETNIRQYYPHAIGHFLGLDVHDAGQPEAQLKPGMVLTVEPGIYIPEEAIGVRIEDNICITEDGFEQLSADCRQQL